jgi:hypothetical protein
MFSRCQNSALGALAAVALASAAAPAHAVAITYGFQDIVNTNDPTFIRNWESTVSG